MAAGLAELGEEASGVTVDKPRPSFDSPGFLEANVEAITTSVRRLVERGTRPGDLRLALVTHSIPVTMDQGSGEPGRVGTRYSDQHLALAAVLVPEVERRLGLSAGSLGYRLVFCSRSGSPRTPWLEPDINDWITEQAQAGATAVCCAPFGFMSDHMEVVYDLDVEARAAAKRQGVLFERAATVGTAPAFISSLVDLMVERAALARREAIHPVSTTDIGAWHWECPADGCRMQVGVDSGIPVVAGPSVASARP